VSIIEAFQPIESVIVGNMYLVMSSKSNLIAFHLSTFRKFFISDNYCNSFNLVADPKYKNIFYFVCEGTLFVSSIVDDNIYPKAIFKDVFSFDITPNFYYVKTSIMINIIGRKLGEIDNRKLGFDIDSCIVSSQEGFSLVCSKTMIPFKNDKYDFSESKVISGLFRNHNTRTFLE